MPGKLQWTNLDPQKVFSMMSSQFGPSFQFDSLRKYMKGVSVLQTGCPRGSSAGGHAVSGPAAVTVFMVRCVCEGQYCGRDSPSPACHGADPGRLDYHAPARGAGRRCHLSDTKELSACPARVSDRH